MNYREWIPVTIKALRNSQNLTLQDLANKSELSVSYLSDIERGRTLPAIDTLDKIFTALGTTLILSFQKDYVPSSHVWVSRDKLKELADLVSDITPKE
jgi:transcriptional regulator with XRE-family HTH domain